MYLPITPIQPYTFDKGAKREETSINYLSRVDTVS